MDGWRSVAILLSIDFLGAAYLFARAVHRVRSGGPRFEDVAGDRVRGTIWSLLVQLGLVVSFATLMFAMLEQLD